MSASTERGPGRPPGSNEEIRERRRKFLSAYELGAPVAEIAARAGLERSTVHDDINKAREERAALTPGAIAPGSPRVEVEPAPPRKLRRGTIMERASILEFSRPVPGVGPTANKLWTSILVAIQEDGDGDRLPIGPGERFHTRDELAVMLAGRDPGAPDVDAAAIVAHLIGRGRLRDVDGVAIAAPIGLGVRAGENARGEPMKPRGRKRRADEGERPLPFPPVLVAGTDFSSGEIPPACPEKPPISPDTMSGKIAPSGPAKPVISPDTPFLASAVVVGGKTQEIQQDKTDNTNTNRAGACPEKLPVSPDKIGISPDTVSGRIPRSAAHELATALRSLIPPVREPSVKDVAWVQRQMDTGYAAAHLIETIKTTPTSGPISCLSYYERPVRDAATMRSGAAAPASAAPEGALPPEPPEPEIAGDGLDAQWQKVRRVVGKAEAKAWLSKCVVGGLDEAGEVTIECPTRFLRDHNHQHHGDRLTARWRAVNPAVQSLRFTVAGAARAD